MHEDTDILSNHDFWCIPRLATMASRGIQVRQATLRRLLDSGVFVSFETRGSPEYAHKCRLD